MRERERKGWGWAENEEEGHKCLGLRKEKDSVSKIHNIENDGAGKACLVQVWRGQVRSLVPGS